MAAVCEVKGGGEGRREEARGGEREARRRTSQGRRHKKVRSPAGPFILNTYSAEVTGLIVSLQGPCRRSEVRVPSAAWSPSRAAGTRPLCPRPSAGRTHCPAAASASPTSSAASPSSRETTPRGPGSDPGPDPAAAPPPPAQETDAAGARRTRTRGWPAAGTSGGGTAWRRCGRTRW